MVTSPSIGYSPSPNPNLNKSRICENLCENLAEAEVGWIRKKGWNWPVVIAGYVSAMRICTRPLKHRHGEDDHISNFSCQQSQCKSDCQLNKLAKLEVNFGKFVTEIIQNIISLQMKNFLEEDMSVIMNRLIAHLKR